MKLFGRKKNKKPDLRMDDEATETFHLCWGEDKYCPDKAQHGKCVIINAWKADTPVCGAELKRCQLAHGKDIDATLPI